MKFELLIVCDSPAALYEVVDRLRGSQNVEVVTLPAREGFPPAPVQPTPLPPQGIAQPPLAPEPEKKVRKARADAGQTRGPNKTTTGGVPEPTPTTSAAPATPKENSAGTPPASPVPPAGVGAPAAAESAKPLTEADARAALKVVNGTKGLGMQACIDAMKVFGVDRITLLPKEKYGEFIAHCQKKVAEARAK